MATPSGVSTYEGDRGGVNEMGPLCILYLSMKMSCYCAYEQLIKPVP